LAELKLKLKLSSKIQWPLFKGTKVAIMELIHSCILKPCHGSGWVKKSFAGAGDGKENEADWLVSLISVLSRGIGMNV
jgi:hypothetical protein